MHKRNGYRGKLYKNKDCLCRERIKENRIKIKNGKKGIV